ncbi:UNVERIFIED_CONTAM: hypothetical protein K2H54_059045 [Gekko kuhli]
MVLLHARDPCGMDIGPEGLPDFFNDIIKVEWALPGSGNSLTSITKKFHALPDNTMEDLKVDSPVVALHSGAMLPKDGENALKDSVDKKNERALKKVQITSVLSQLKIIWQRKRHERFQRLLVLQI